MEEFCSSGASLLSKLFSTGVFIMPFCDALPFVEYVEYEKNVGCCTWDGAVPGTGAGWEALCLSVFKRHLGKALNNTL